ncbi:unnamed protein product [Zymoseptoria tritici ST99CH_3D1]|nr:unnamed protein product [Zymoseptoria tritici ST99CH_3D1]
MAMDNMFADFEVEARENAPGRGARATTVRKAAATQWNRLPLADQNGLQADLTAFYALHAQLERDTTDDQELGNEPQTNVGNIATNYARDLQLRVTDRTNHITTINRLITQRNLHANTSATALAYLQVLRIRHATRLQEDQDRLNALNARLPTMPTQAAQPTMPAQPQVDGDENQSSNDQAAPQQGQTEPNAAQQSTDRSDQAEEGGARAGGGDPDNNPGSSDDDSSGPGDGKRPGAKPSPPDRDLDPEEQRKFEGTLKVGWVKVQGLSGGQHGNLNVWAKVNAMGIIIDRLVLKHCTPRSSGVTWDADNDMPIEASAMLRLNRPGRPGSDRIVQLRSWRRSRVYEIEQSDTTNLWLYLEYCSRGCLADLLDNYVDENGELFLGENTGDTFRGLPTAKMGDFGAAVFAPEDDTRPFDDFHQDDYGTDACRAPEQLSETLIGDQDDRRRRMTSKTNLWAVGNTMWSLIHCKEGDPALEKGFDREHLTPHAFGPEVKAEYSSTLTDLIMTCLQYLPEDRPTMDHVLSEIRAVTGVKNSLGLQRKDRARGLRAAAKDDKRFLKYGPRIGTGGFPMGVLLSELVPDLPFELPKRGDGKRTAEEAFADDSDTSDVSSESDDDLGGEEGSLMRSPIDRSLLAEPTRSSSRGDDESSGQDGNASGMEIDDDEGGDNENGSDGEQGGDAEDTSDGDGIPDEEDGSENEDEVLIAGSSLLSMAADNGSNKSRQSAERTEGGRPADSGPLESSSDDQGLQDSGSNESESSAVPMSPETKRKLEGRLNDDWLPAMNLSAGVTGAPRLWVKQNSEGLIVDVKLRNWRWGEEDELDDGNGVSVSVRALWLYMEYCGHGDLSKLAEKAERPTEPFLWSVFEDLVTAAILLERGHLDTRDASPDWELIVHRDIKLGNVFLGDNKGDAFCGFPTAKVGDFGAACIISKKDTRTFKEFGDLGTPANQAPEQLSESLLDDDPDVTTHTLSSATNVWAIGNVMWSVLMKSEGDDALAEGFTKEHMEPGAFPTEVENLYSSELRDLIMLCVVYWPQHRITLDNLLFYIKKATSKDFAAGLRSAPKNDPKFAKYRPALGEEEWAIGTAWSLYTDDLSALPESRKRPPDRDLARDSKKGPKLESPADVEDLGGKAGSFAEGGVQNVDKRLMLKKGKSPVNSQSSQDREGSSEGDFS